MEVVFEETAYCEHCGEMPPFYPIVVDDGITWCVWCANANGSMTAAQAKHWEHESYQMRIGWHEIQIFNLKELIKKGE